LIGNKAFFLIFILNIQLICKELVLYFELIDVDYFFILTKMYSNKILGFLSKLIIKFGSMS